MSTDKSEKWKIQNLERLGIVPESLEQRTAPFCLNIKKVKIWVKKDVMMIQLWLRFVHFAAQYFFSFLSFQQTSIVISNHTMENTLILF